jgi:aryl-alcohol dehydrogenase-like predicted oxidoreductase
MGFSTPIEETLDALDSLVRAGKVRYLGASSMAAWQFSKALYTAKEHGWHRFVAMQNHYNLIYREEEREMNPLCVDQGVGLIPWSPLARGFLAGRPQARTTAKPSTKRAQTDQFGKRTVLPRQSDHDVADAVRRSRSSAA